MVFTKKAKVLTAAALAAAVGLGGFGIYRANAANPRTVKFVDITAESGDLVAQDSEVKASGVIEDNVALNTITLTDSNGDPATHTWANDFVMFMVDKQRGVVREIKDTTLLNSLGLPAGQNELTIFYLTNADKADVTKIPAAGEKADSDGDKVKWFISGKKLIAVGESAKLQLTPNATATGAVLTNLWGNYTNEDNRYVDGSTIMEDYGDFTGEGWGIKPESTIGLEKTLSESEYYPAADYIAKTEIGTDSGMYTVDMSARDEGVVPGTNVITTQIPAGLPAATNTTAADLPWADPAVADKLADVEEFYLGSDIEVSGNASYMFNINTVGPTYGQSQWWRRVKPSAFENLKDIYLYGDLSGVSRTTGMFARCHNLENIYATASAADFKNVNTAAYMFYGDSRLKSVSGTNDGEKSILDVMDFSGTTGTLKDTAFMFAGCEAMEEPVVKNFDMSGVQSATGMFYGAGNAKLTFADNAKGHYIGGWDLTSLIDGVDMFLGTPLGIDDKDDDPMAPTAIFGQNILGNEDGSVLTEEYLGTVISGPVALWKMPALQSMNLMFAYNDGITSVEFNNDEGGNAYTALKEMSEAFLCDPALASVTVKDGKQVSFPALKYTQFAFAGCGGESNGSVDLSMSAPLLETAAMMFYDTSFKDISFADSDDFAALTDASGMFAKSELENADLSSQSFAALEKARMIFFDDPKLKTVKEPTAGFDFSALLDGSYAFTNDILLTSLKTSGWKVGTPAAGTDLHNIFQNSGIAEVSLAGAGASLTDLSLAFSNCPNLAKFTGPADMTAVSNAFGMLANNPVLSMVALSDTAPADLKDLRGAFAFCPQLTDLYPGSIVSNSARYLSNMFKGDSALQDIDLSKFDTTGAVYMDGMFDGDKKLKRVIVGTASLKPDNAITLGALFRNCNLIDSALETIIGSLANSGKAKDMYAMFEGNKSITKADLSGMDFSSANDLSRIFYGCDSLGVVDSSDPSNIDLVGAKKIVLPADFGDMCDSENAVEMFYIEKDSSGSELDKEKPSDDVLSCVLVDGTEYPVLIKNYDFSGDNRKFALITKQTVNGTPGATYKFTGTEDAELVVEGLSTLLMKDGAGNNVSAPLRYEWTDRLSSDEAENSLDENDRDYTATSEKYGDGKSYVVTAKVKPALLTKAKEGTAVFILNAVPTKVTATYEGDPVPISKDFDKDDVKVVITLPDGSEVTIPSSGWTAPSTKVEKEGDNPFTVTYTDGTTNYPAEITVPGVRIIGSIETKYTGPAVKVGDDYDSKYLETTAYYLDDVNKTMGFAVTPNYYSGKKIKEAGDNVYTATYLDSKNNNNPLTSTFTVQGYEEGVRVIGAIETIYTGPAVTVGEEYDTDYLETTAYYADDVNHTMGFTVTPNYYSGKKIKAVGANSFTATYIDSANKNNALTSTFTVPGYKEISAVEAVYNGPKIEVGKDYALSDVVVTLYYADGSGSNTVTDFTVDSTTVTAEGDNSFMAKWRNPFGVSYSAGFTVPGYVKADGEEPEDEKGDTPAPPTDDKTDTDKPADTSDVFPGYAPVPSQTATTPSSTTPSNATTVTTGTSTGVVQTGNEGKTVLYILAIIALVTMMVVLLVKKKKNEEDDF